jgi:hypothetical protein
MALLMNSTKHLREEITLVLLNLCQILEEENGILLTKSTGGTNPKPIRRWRKYETMQYSLIVKLL